MVKTLLYKCLNCGKEYKLTIRRVKATSEFSKEMGIKCWWVPTKEVLCCEKPQPCDGKEINEEE